MALFAPRVFAVDCIPPPDSLSEMRAPRILGNALLVGRRHGCSGDLKVHLGASDYQFTLMRLKSSGGLPLMDDL